MQASSSEAGWGLHVARGPPATRSVATPHSRAPAAEQRGGAAMCPDNSDAKDIEVGEEAREVFSGEKRGALGKRGSRKLERLYRVGDVLGKGGFGTVYSGQRRKDGMSVAIKHIARSKVTEMELVSLVRHSCFREVLVTY